MENQQTITSISNIVSNKGEQLRTRNKKKLFLEAYKGSLGNMTIARNRAGIKSNTTVYNWMDADPIFKESMDNILLDQRGFVEYRLMQSIDAGKWGAIRFYLSRCHPNYMNCSRRIKDIEDVKSFLHLEHAIAERPAIRCADCGSSNIEVLHIEGVTNLH